MKFLRCGFFLLLALAFMGVSQAAAEKPTWQVSTASSLVKITAKEKGVPRSFEANPIMLKAVRGEWESFQIVITAGQEKLACSVEATPLVHKNETAIDAGNIDLYWENYVYVDHPSGNAELEPLWWPDALIPVGLQHERPVEPGKSEVLWYTVKVPDDAVPGDYTGIINVRSGGRAIPVVYSLTVLPVSMPAPTMRANVAVYYEILRDWYKKNLDQEFTPELKQKYYDFLLDYHINAYDLPVAWDDPKAAAYLKDVRVRGVRLPPLDNKVEFDKALKTLRENKALDKAYYYWIDEPSPDDYARVKETTDKLHAIDPAIKHCVTVHPNESLENAVDIWCPNIGDFFGIGYIDLDWMARERKKGRETWWYTMVEPKWPYPTWLLDDSALSVVSYGPLMYANGMTGFVYSMAHGWGPKPLEDLQSYANTNGDGTLLYPAELVGGDGPMPSIRLMLLRDAIEDWELLHQFRGSNDLVKDLMWRPDTLFIQPASSAENYQKFHNNLRDGLAGKKIPEPPLRKFDHVGYSMLIQEADAIPKIDGKLEPQEWPDKYWNTDGVWANFLPVPQPEAEVAWMRKGQDKMYVAFRVQTKSFEKDWCAIDMASNSLTERLRFVVTAKGNGVVEKHTREGHFRLEDSGWKYAVERGKDSYTVEMEIPLDLIDIVDVAGMKPFFRMNALRRIGDPNTNIIVSFAPYAGDIRNLEIATLE